MKTLRAVLSGLCALFVLSGAAMALELPGTVCFQVATTRLGDPSYLDATIHTDPPSVLDAWCIDTDHAISTASSSVYTARVYELGDPEVPGLFDRTDAMQNLDLVLFILNQKYPGQDSVSDGVFTSGDVQRAIWDLLEDNQATGALGPWSQLRVDEILADAHANGEGFVPGCGDLTVLFLNPVLLGCDPDTTLTDTVAQICVVEVPVECASIGDRVWYDTNANGIQDDGEEGVPDVTVNLMDCNGNVIDTTTTDANGNYLFDGLVPGDYNVQFVLPNGFVFSPRNAGDDAADSDADLTDGTTECTELTPGETDLSWDAGIVPVPPPDCDLAVDATCAVEEPDVPMGECDGGVTELILEYTGAGCEGSNNSQDPSKAECTTPSGASFDPAKPVTVVYVGSSADKIEVVPAGEIDAGALIAVVPFATDKLPSETKLAIYQNGMLVQLQEVHTSCSQPLNLGDQFGSFGLVEYTSKDGGTVGYPEPPEPSQDCTFVPSMPGVDYCETKVKALEFLYVGGDCSLNNNPQDGKAECTTYTAPTEPVRILVTDKADAYDTGAKVFANVSDVMLNELVMATASAGGANEFGSATYVHIFDASGNLAQSLNIHTSCSQPLSLGDRFGGLIVFGIDRKDLGPVTLGQSVTFTYDVTNTGDIPIENVVVEDSYGTVNGSPILLIGVGETVTLTRQAILMTAFTNTVTAMEATGLCEATDEVVVTVEEPEIPCADCHDLGQLSLVYDGPDGYVKIIDNGGTLFEGDLAAGDEITITGSKSDGQFDGNDLKVYIDGDESTKIHVSCSKPIGPGAYVGWFQVTEAINKDGSPVCPVGDCQECKGGITRLTLRNNGPDAVVVARDDKVELFNGLVSSGTVFTVIGSKSDGKFEGDALFLSVDGGPAVELHTSCSDDTVAPGLVIGDLEIIDGYSKDRGQICPIDPVETPDCQDCHDLVMLSLMYDGPAGYVLIADSGGTLFEGDLVAGDEVTVTGTKDDGQFDGNELKVYIDGDANIGIHVSCSKPIGPGAYFGWFQVTEAVNKDGSTVCPAPDCQECKGGITRLTLRNNGAEAIILAADDKVVLFDALVPAGAEFTVLGSKDDGTFEGNALFLSVDGADPVELHTSCSDETVGPGLVIGDLEIVEAYSKDNGKICDLPTPGEGPIECSSAIQALLLMYIGPQSYVDAMVTVQPSKGASVSTVVTDLSYGATVVVGSQSGWTIDALAQGEDALGSRTLVLINGVAEDVHTSCSAPVVINQPMPLSDPKGDPSPNWLVLDFRQK